MARALTGKFAKTEVMAGFESGLADEGPRLATYIDEFQRAESLWDMAQFQFRLLAYFGAHQVVGDELREAEAADRTSLSELLARDPKPLEEVQVQQALLDNTVAHVRSNSMLLHAIRCLADGLAWRALEFDRCAITILGDGDRVGRLADLDGSGFQAELQRICGYWNYENRLALHNDMTNCLCHGDLTLVSASKPGLVVLDEVKASGKMDVSSAQYKRMDRKVKLLNDGYELDGPDGRTVRLHRLPVPYRTHAVALADVLDEAYGQGEASREVEDGVVVSAIDYRMFDDRPADILDWFNRAPAARGWTRQNSRLVQSTAMKRRMDDRIKAHPYLAPVTLLRADAIVLADLLLGQVDYSVTIRLEAVEAAFATRGITAACVAGEEANRLFLRASRGGHDVEVPAHAREQMLQETMTTATLVDVVERILDALDRGASPSESHMLFCDELDAWPVPVAVATT